MIQEKNYSYIVYYFENDKLEVLLEYNGKYKNRIIQNNSNCYICSKGVGKYKKVDKYINAVAKLYEEESEEKNEK